MSRAPATSRQVIKQSQNATQAVQLKEVLRLWGINLGWREKVGAAQCNGCVPTVGKPDDEVRLDALAYAHNLDPLSAKWMMRMGDGDESRK